MEAAAAADRHVHFTDNFIIVDTAAALVGFNSQLGPVSQSQGSSAVMQVLCMLNTAYLTRHKLKSNNFTEAV